MEQKQMVVLSLNLFYFIYFHITNIRSISTDTGKQMDITRHLYALLDRLLVDFHVEKFNFSFSHCRKIFRT